MVRLVLFLLCWVNDAEAMQPESLGDKAEINANGESQMPEGRHSSHMVRRMPKRKVARDGESPKAPKNAPKDDGFSSVVLTVGSDGTAEQVPELDAPSDVSSRNIEGEVNGALSFDQSVKAAEDFLITLDANDVTSLSATLASIDKDRDGNVTFWEVITSFERPTFAESINASKVEALLLDEFSAGDADNDGELNLSEFKIFVQRDQEIIAAESRKNRSQRIIRNQSFAQESVRALSERMQAAKKESFETYEGFSTGLDTTMRGKDRRRRLPTATDTAWEVLKTSRNDISPYGKNIGSQLDAMETVTPVTKTLCCAGGYTTAIGGHVQGMARIKTGWVSTSSMAEGYVDDYLLGVSSTTELKKSVLVDETTGHIGGATSAGNVVAVQWMKPNGPTTHPIQFFDFTSGSAERMTNLEFSLEDSKALQIGMAFNPMRNRYVFLEVRTFNDRSYRVYESTGDKLISNPCAQGSCWSPIGGWTLFGVSNLRPSGFDMTADGSQESGSLIFDESEKKLYWFSFGRVDSRMKFTACKLHAITYHVESCRENIDLDNNMDGAGGHWLI